MFVYIIQEFRDYKVFHQKAAADEYVKNNREYITQVFNAQKSSWVFYFRKKVN